MKDNPYDIKDIQLPEDILWWPPTLMTWLSLLLLLLIVVAVVWFLWRLRKRKVGTYINSTLEALFARYKNDFDASAFARDVSVLLKRIYITIRGRHIAALSGKHWLHELDQGLDDKPFTTGVGKVLGSAPYQPAAEYDVESLYVLCKRRIASLRVS